MQGMAQRRQLVGTEVAGGKEVSERAGGACGGWDDIAFFSVKLAASKRGLELNSNGKEMTQQLRHTRGMAEKGLRGTAR